MHSSSAGLGRLAALTCGLTLLVPATRGFADEPTTQPRDATVEADVPKDDLFDALQKGQVPVAADGGGDGRMILSLPDHSERQVGVVIPPGLIATGATGQAGGVGGMGGGMGGMGGGMGGMGGGMGGMGGGMGGMGGGGMG